MPLRFDGPKIDGAVHDAREETALVACQAGGVGVVATVEGRAAGTGQKGSSRPAVVREAAKIGVGPADTAVVVGAAVDGGVLNDVDVRAGRVPRRQHR